MSNSTFGNSGENENILQVTSKSRNAKLVATTILLSLVLSFSGLIGFKYFSQKNTFADGCRNLVLQVNTDFNAYRSSTHKPTLLGDEDFSPSNSSLTLSRSLRKLRELSEENSMYSGSGKTVDALNLYNEELNKFQLLKGKQFAAELSNPFKVELEVWVDVTKRNIYRSLTDSAFSQRLKRLGGEYEKGWDSHMTAKLPKDFKLDLQRAGKQVEKMQSELFTICKGAQ